MRKLNDHKVNSNDTLTVIAEDEPGPGGAHHHYTMLLPDWSRHPDGSHAHNVWDVHFQNGPIGEVGANGITNEALLAIVTDRLRCFQSGPFACRENALALTKIEEALHWLHSRTRERIARGVEGTNAS